MHKNSFHGGIEESFVRILVTVRSSNSNERATTRFTAILRCLVYWFGQQLVELEVRWLSAEC